MLFRGCTIQSSEMNHIICDGCEQHVQLGQNVRDYTDQSSGHPVVFECEACVHSNLRETIKPLTTEKIKEFWDKRNLNNYVWCQNCEQNLLIGDLTYVSEREKYCMMIKGSLIIRSLKSFWCQDCWEGDNHTEITQEHIDQFWEEQEMLAEQDND